MGLSTGVKFITNGVLVKKDVGCPAAGYTTRYIGYSTITGNNLSYSKVIF